MLSVAQMACLPPRRRAPKRLVRRYRRKVFLIIDNAPCHNLEAEGVAWLAANRHRIELQRLPAYSTELNAIEGVWKVTRRTTAHNRYFDLLPTQLPLAKPKSSSWHWTVSR